MTDSTNKEGSALLAEVFNVLTDNQKNALPDDVKKRIGNYMFYNGYKMVFTRFYLQAEAKKE